MLKQFLNEMNRYVPEDAHIMLCQFRGDPNEEKQGKWVAKPLTRLDQVDDLANVYLTVAAMGKNGRGEYRRRKENFRGGLLLMIDDIGDGKGSKWPMSLIDPLPPTALVETSPGNFQAVYMFNKLLESLEEFDHLIKAFIAKQFIGADPGMAGVNRVFRPPAGVNGKPKYNHWEVKLAQWNPGARYSPEDLFLGFQLPKVVERTRPPAGACRDKGESIRAFISARSALRAAGMLKRESSNLEGWIDIVCPWAGNHTGGADNGAAIREPAEENGWQGAFRCHHGSCSGKGWRHLTDWLAQEEDELLTAVNDNAGGFDEYTGC
jgi:hypothetical protein